MVHIDVPDHVDQKTKDEPAKADHLEVRHSHFDAPGEDNMIDGPGSHIAIIQLCNSNLLLSFPSGFQTKLMEFKDNFILIFKPKSILGKDSKKKKN